MMVKLRFANLGAELDGDPKEIVSILRDLGVSHKETNPITPPDETPRLISSKETPVSNEELFRALPTKQQIIEMIEEMGEPYSFSLTEQQVKIFGRIISSRDNRPVYSKLYELHKYARDAITKKYGGHWTTSNEVVDGHQTVRYTWVANEDARSHYEESDVQQTEGSDINQD